MQKKQEAGSWFGDERRDNVAEESQGGYRWRGDPDGGSGSLARTIGDVLGEPGGDRIARPRVHRACRIDDVQ